MTRALASLILLLSCAPLLNGQAPGSPPVFGARVETVYVDAFVTQGGRVVRGLEATDFELRDEGVPQRIELVSTESFPLLAMLVFDASGSITDEKLAALRVAGEAFLAGLRPQDEAALLAFSEEIAWLARPTRDKEEVRNALQRLRAQGGTAAFDALYAGLTLPAPRARSLVVLFSDGEDNMSWLDERRVRAVAERSNAVVQCVGVRSDSPEPEPLRTLREIALLTGGRFWRAESFPRLREAFAAIIETMNTRYVLGYEPQGVKRTGWHRIELRLKKGKGEVHARRGYWSAAEP